MSQPVIWEVIGGQERGGILVRRTSDLSSPAEEQRLATGALVKELRFVEQDCRLHYELLSGAGPASGWVTTSLRDGKELLAHKEIEVAVEEVQAQEMQVKQPSSATDDSTSGGDSDSDSDLPELVDARSEEETSGENAGILAVSKEELEAEKVQKARDAEKALRRYAEKFGQQRDGADSAGYNRRAFAWAGKGAQDPAVPNQTEKADQQELDAALAAFCKPGQQSSGKRQARLKDVDAEGEQVTLCAHCLLPVGENAYVGKEDESTFVHGECMAQLMLQEIKERDERRLLEEAEKKMRNRQEYNIGWDVSNVPKNAATAERMGLDHCPKGLCCLVLDEGSQTVRVAATHEPKAAVNLEYLLLALKARCHACREPLFSLDPVDPEHIETSMQAKRFEPRWLAGTSVGEVMFQADYYLKELAMGEQSMPMLGMLSVFDWSDAAPSGKPWTGREWFVVKKAEIRMAEDNTLIPEVKMGVEAREQVMTSYGLQDVPCNSPDHPLQKFADAFTKNFDLIAERKSVIFHLRELAKASVMAKFLIESSTLPVEWLKMADGVVKDSSKQDQCMEIPQLWNMRGQSRIQVVDGKILNSETGQWSQLRSVYGGIEFGLDRFELAQRHMLRPVGVGGPAASSMQMSLQGMQLGPTGRPGFAPTRFQLTQRPITGPAPQEQPQGVDLNLDKFQLSAPDRFAGVLPACSANLDSLEANTMLGKAFLQNIRDGSATAFRADDIKLLKTVYFSSLCDRMDEDDAFVPPDPDAKHIARLRNLVSEEEELRQQRRRLFSEASFVVGNAGPEFPASWTSTFQVDQQGLSPGLMQTALASSLVQLVVDMSFCKTLLCEVLPTATPEFEKATEDGTLFRVYRFSSLEIRTIQEPNKAEMVEAVFSVRPIAWQEASCASDDAVRDEERLAKVSLYVEATNAALELNRSLHGRAAELSEGCDAPSQGLAHCHYYLVLETDAGGVLVTEKLGDGSCSLAVNPANLTDRNSLARLLHSADCVHAGVSVRDLKVFRNQSARQTPDGACPSDRQIYAKNVFKLASGTARLVRKAKGAGKGPAPGAARAPMQPQARKTYSSTVNYGQN